MRRWILLFPFLHAGVTISMGDFIAQYTENIRQETDSAVLIDWMYTEWSICITLVSNT